MASTLAAYDSDFTEDRKSTILFFPAIKRNFYMRKALIIFGQLTDSDVDWMAGAGERIHIKAGTTLIKRGSRVDHLYIVLDGQLDIRTAAGGSHFWRTPIPPASRRSGRGACSG